MAREETKVVEYALGCLDPGDRAAFERELEASADLRTELAEVTSMLDQIADAEPSLAPQPQLRERLLKSVQPESRFEGFVDRLAQMFDLSVARIREILRDVKIGASEAWESVDIPGVDLLHFAGGPRVATADCGLVRLAPGAAFPHHTHRGDEWALVLAGEAMDDQGRVARPGDLTYMCSGSGHAFRAAGGGELLLAVVVHEGITIG